uniref:Uncharacterized protein n=1 Tax=viral metagenome TaxID=1070528 RepID=A0A6H1ZRZ4_9ZZZZ
MKSENDSSINLCPICYRVGDKTPLMATEEQATDKIACCKIHGPIDLRPYLSQSLTPSFTPDGVQALVIGNFKIRMKNN